MLTFILFFQTITERNHKIFPANFFQFKEAKNRIKHARFVNASIGDAKNKESLAKMPRKEKKSLTYGPTKPILTERVIYKTIKSRGIRRNKSKNKEKKNRNEMVAVINLIHINI